MRVGALAGMTALSFALAPRAWADETYPIRFVADGTESFVAAVAGQSCRTPCVLALAPGEHQLIASGTSPLNLRIRVPHAPGVVRLYDPERAVLIAGAVILPLGAAIGATLWAPIFAQARPPSETHCPDCNFGLFVEGLTASVVVGSVFVITGVGLFGYWATHQNSDAAVDVEGTDPHLLSLRLTSVGLLPSRNGLSTGVAFSF